jgi:transcription-repair coupling factor (superfamily II helicase)
VTREVVGARPERTIVLDPDALGPFPELDRLADLLDTRRRASGGNLWGSSQALVLAALARRSDGPWLVATSTDAEAQVFVDDLAAFGASAEWLPAREEPSGGSKAHADVETLRLRLRVAQRLAGPAERRPRIVAASILSLLQPVPSPMDLERDYLALFVHQRLSPEDLLQRLIANGYVRMPLSEKPGEVSLRGEILDVFPFAAELPLRIEMFDDQVESLRTFDPLDQRSVESSLRIEVCIAADVGGVEDGSGVLPATLLPRSAVAVRVEPLRIEDRAEGLRIRSPAHACALARLLEITSAHPRLDLQSLPAEVDFGARSVQALSVGSREAPRALREAALDGSHAIVLCRNASEEHRFLEVLAEAGGAAGVETRIGSVAKGFRLPSIHLVLVNHRELAGVIGRRAAPKPPPAHRVRAIQSFFELKAGDLVVHAVHGLARFTGLRRLERNGGEEEHLQLLFADEVALYVPSSRIDLVQRYVGAGSATLPLDHIGSQSFRRRKERVERALLDLAAELLEVQARRALKTRKPWESDAELVRDMVGSFPYPDTADQIEVDREIAADLAAGRPMDRLLCGDVGFGKTELAVRAAFRVVSGGAQVAVLVPTTVLAQQHYETFRERLADFPVEVAELSRYVGGRQEREVLERLEHGQTDVIIGTHRILSSDVRFKNLGLVVIDEEQRFGVAHKEHFKKLRAEIDLLTLTATPIPRTLHMSLSGVRDISALTVPPEGRQEIETLIGYTDEDDVLREALLREKNRGGQVFFLHNRVGSIRAAAARLSRLAPECSFGVGHGQMGARELERVMEAFTSGEIDVLVATTIIESGIDIPAAGTIVVDEADQFGLSELHQLRGRVGRGAHKAYCYLLVERHKPLREEARARLKALEEMNQLGAGFAISMKDLEIRGAGNILGPQQSGHIAAVGYDMYCRLLKRAVESLQAGAGVEAALAETPEEGGAELELGLRAYLPEDWIPDARTRLEIHRALAAIRGAEDEARATEMLSDRFGRVPQEAQNLLRSLRLKSALERISVTRLSWRKGFYLVEYGDRVALEHGLDLRGVELRAVRTGVAHLRIPEDCTTPEGALAWVEGLLKGGPRAPKMATSERTP